MSISSSPTELWPGERPAVEPVAYRRRSRPRVRPYLLRPADPGLLSRVLDGLRALPDRRPPQPLPQSPPPREPSRTPLVRLIDAQKAPTEEIPVVSAGVVVS